VDYAALARVGAPAKRAMLGEGNYDGLYQRPDTDMAALWAVAVEETRAELAGDWF
jgi:creatinine amidohydrolase